jgi:hypothetical protein
MNKRHKVKRLAKTKLALAEKYGRLAAEARSLPKKTQLRHKAEKYRRQAAEALRT